MAQISNKPSFRLDRQPSTKAQLQYIGNLSRGDRPKRTIVVAASLTTTAETALQWVIDNLAKVGDAIHICHVCKCLEEQTEIYHSGPGNAFKVPDVRPHHERDDVVASQLYLKQKFVPMLVAAGLLYEVHVFVDTFAAPPDAVGHTVLTLAAELHAAAVVVAANDGVADEEVSPDPLRLGSVAKWMSEQRSQPVPVVIVRHPPGHPERPVADPTTVQPA